ncbi:MAG: bile acid:sodium symporter family protein [bacterium]
MHERQSAPRSFRDILKGLHGNTSVILSLAFFAGLVFNRAAPLVQPAVTPILAFIMTVSLLEIPSEIFLNIRELTMPALISLFLSYILLSGVIIGAASLIIPDNDLWTGFVLIATVPPAVSVIPYTYLLDGNTRFSLIGSTVAYLAAMVFTPLISVLVLGTSYVSPARLIGILTVLIILPFIISRLLRHTQLKGIIIRFRRYCINWGFFVVAYTIIGLNRDSFLTAPLTLVRLILVAFISTFALGLVIEYVCTLLRVNAHDRISLMLIGTRKNYGLAAAISLLFFDPRTATSIAVCMAVAILHFIWLQTKWGQTTSYLKGGT